MGRGPSIEARKNASDAKRGKIFTKIIREIGVAARGGGGDPNNNPRLRVAVDKGLAVNMSKDVIERAIKKATGELEGVDYEEIRYEGYAPGGVAVIVDCLTDNRVRTVADVRHAFSKCGGNMGTEGSVAFMFKRLGVLSFGPGADEEAITEAAIEAGSSAGIARNTASAALSLALPSRRPAALRPNDPLGGSDTPSPTVAVRRAWPGVCSSMSENRAAALPRNPRAATRRCGRQRSRRSGHPNSSAHWVCAG